MAPSMESPLGKARGLGSARSGVSHWWMQRITAMGMIPLVLYLVAGFVLHAGSDYDTARQWLTQPFNASATLLLFACGFFHANLGLQVIVEDYISKEKTRLLSLVAIKLVTAALATLSIFSVLSIAFS
ncbi:MAG: succinate dehydrogenase, hydrophobic membrane anchor protein [Candidatus Puniceispirillales bacterium]